MRVLLISIAYPPKSDPESLQVAKYCRYLSQHAEIDVITSKNPTLFMGADRALDSYAHGHIAREVKILENKYSNFLLRKINPALLQLPDSKFSFWLQAKDYSGDFDILYSRSYPISSTLYALKIKQQTNKPWVLHLSDPWSISSEEFLTPATGYKGFARRWNGKMEKRSFALADTICFTSHKTIALYAAHYPQWRHKFQYYPNVYDDAYVVDNPYKKAEVLTFLHTGGFGEARSPVSFLKSLKHLWDHFPQHRKRFQFTFTGDLTRANKEIFDQYNDVQFIRHTGILPYSEIVQLQRRADILVNIDSDIKDARHSVFFPSKLLDYMAAQRRVLAITNEHSVTHSVVQGKLGDCFDFSDTEGLVSFFLKTLEMHEKSRENYFYKPQVPEEFSAKKNAGRLHQLFLRLSGADQFSRSA